MDYATYHLFLEPKTTIENIMSHTIHGTNGIFAYIAFYGKLLGKYTVRPMDAMFMLVYWSKSPNPIGIDRKIKKTRPILGCSELDTLPETNIAPENRLGPKRKRSYSNHPFLGVNSLLVLGRVLL